MAQANPVAALGNIYKTPELWEKIRFTFIVLVVFRIGTHVTVPGVDTAALLSYFQTQSQGILGLYDLFVGGSLSRATVFALGIMPYISASIFMQIAGAVFPQVEKLSKNCRRTKKAGRR
jgi:preprotein translocase subunit SecY